MPTTVERSVRFAAPAKELYDLYLDPRRHAAVTGAPVKISPKPGSKFSAFDGMISGVTLANVPRHDRAGVTQGWKKYYWKPLRAYLKRTGG